MRAKESLWSASLAIEICGTAPTLVRHKAELEELPRVLTVQIWPLPGIPQPKPAVMFSIASWKCKLARDASGLHIDT